MNGMKYVIPAWLAAAVCLPAAAASFDGSVPLLCSIRTVIECDQASDCYPTSPENVNLPDFFEIKFADKEIVAAGARRAGAKTPIERIEHMAGKVLLQGGDIDEENEHGGVGWSMLIDESDGRLSMSGVTQEFALVVNGACMVR